MKKTFLLFISCVACSGCTLTVPQPVAVVQAPVVVAPVAVVDPAPMDVQEYYMISGRYYYWHPGFGRYEVLCGPLPPGRRAVGVDRFDHLPSRSEFHPAPTHGAPPSKPEEKKKKTQNSQ